MSKRLVFGLVAEQPSLGARESRNGGEMVETEDLTLTAMDVERLAQVANGEMEGDEAMARSALSRAVRDAGNFREPWVFAAAERFARHLGPHDPSVARSAA